MAGRRGDFSIAGYQRSVKQFGKRHVCSIVSPQCLPEFPYPWDQEIAGITVERGVGKILERFLPSSRRDRLIAHVPSHHLGHFHVQEMGRVERLRRSEDPLVDPKAGA